MARRLYFIIYLLLVLVPAKGQTASQLTREGNRLFSSRNYAQAEVLYRKAVDKEADYAIANYNLGRSLQAQGKNDEAEKQYEKAARLEKDPVRKSSSYNNLGTILQGKKDYVKAIEAYKNALRCNPGHANARYNFELCKRQQKKQQKKSSGKGKDKSDKKRDKKNPNGNPSHKQQQKKRQQQDNQSMSKDNAEQLLNAVKQQEKETQQRLSRAMRQPSERKLDKNW